MSGLPNSFRHALDYLRSSQAGGTPGLDASGRLILMGLVCQETPLSMEEISHTTGIKLRTLERKVIRMVREEWLARVMDPDDMRRSRFLPAPKGVFLARGIAEHFRS